MPASAGVFFASLRKRNVCMVWSCWKRQRPQGVHRLKHSAYMYPLSFLQDLPMRDSPPPLWLFHCQQPLKTIRNPFGFRYFLLFPFAPFLVSFFRHRIHSLAGVSGYSSRFNVPFMILSNTVSPFSHSQCLSLSLLLCLTSQSNARPRHPLR